MHRSSSPLIAAALLTALAGCWEGSLYGERPKDKVLDDAIDRMWAAEMRRVARDGDWVLSRSFSPEGDMVGWVSIGENFSHASMIDVTNGTIVEAITPKVREITIEELVHRNWYLVIVRPSGIDAEESKAALERARSQVGVDFDMYGIFGYEEPDKWFCSELAYWASGFEESAGKHAFLAPNELMNYGEVLYYTGRRDDPQVLKLAAGFLNSGHDTAVAGASGDPDDVAIEIMP